MNEMPVLGHLAVLLVRPGVVVALAPTFGGLYTSPHTKVALTVLLAIGLLPSVAVPPAVDVGVLGTFIAREVAYGYGPDHWVAGSLGPGTKLASLGQMGFIDQREGICKCVCNSC